MRICRFERQLIAEIRVELMVKTVRGDPPIQLEVIRAENIRWLVPGRRGQNRRIQVDHLCIGVVIPFVK